MSDWTIGIAFAMSVADGVAVAMVVGLAFAMLARAILLRRRRGKEGGCGACPTRAKERSGGF